MQSRMQSLIEAIVNIGSGFIISLCLWQVLAHWYGYDMPLSRNVEITTIFTFVSIARSYIFRRFFNWRHGNETSDSCMPAGWTHGTGTERTVRIRPDMDTSNVDDRRYPVRRK